MIKGLLGSSDSVAGAVVIKGFFSHRSGFCAGKAPQLGVEPAGALWASPSLCGLFAWSFQHGSSGLWDFLYISSGLPRKRTRQKLYRLLCLRNLVLEIMQYHFRHILFVPCVWKACPCFTGGDQIPPPFDEQTVKEFGDVFKPPQRGRRWQTATWLDSLNEQRISPSVFEFGSVFPMMQKGLAQILCSTLVTNMFAPRGLDPLTPVNSVSSLCQESSFQLKFDYWFLILVPFFMLMALLADSELPWVQIKYNRIANQAIRIRW